MVSLIDQLGIRDTFYFLSSRGPWDPLIWPRMPMASFTITETNALFRPPKTLPLFKFMRPRLFDYWWNEFCLRGQQQYRLE